MLVRDLLGDLVGRRLLRRNSFEHLGVDRYLLDLVGLVLNLMHHAELFLCLVQLPLPAQKGGKVIELGLSEGFKDQAGERFSDLLICSLSYESPQAYALLRLRHRYLDVIWLLAEAGDAEHRFYFFLRGHRSRSCHSRRYLRGFWLRLTLWALVLIKRAWHVGAIGILETFAS